VHETPSEFSVAWFWPGYRTALAISGFLLLFLTGTASALDPHRMGFPILRTQSGGLRTASHTGQKSSLRQTTATSGLPTGPGLLRFDGVTMPGADAEVLPHEEGSTGS